MRSFELETVVARNGDPCFRLLLDDGRRLTLNSPYDPAAEGSRWASHLTPSPHQVLLVVGMAAGHHLVALLPRLLASNLVLVWEPVPQVPVALADDPRILRLRSDARFFFSSTPAELWDRLEAVPNWYWKRLLPLVLPAYEQAFPLEVAAFVEEVARRQNELQLLRNTVEHSAGLWQKNLMRNLGAVARSTPVSSGFGSLPGVPAVIVSAGPSLDENVSLLREAEGRALVIGTGTAARKLALEGLPYHLVTSIAPNEVNYSGHFEGVDHGSRPLVFDPIVCPEVPARHGGPLAVMPSFPDLAWLGSYFKGGMDDVKSGASVSAVSFDLARRLGCDPIILIGQDLSYGTDRSHAAGTWKESRWAEVPKEWLDGDPETLRRKAREQPWNPWFTSMRRLMVEGIDGRPRVTDIKMLSFLTWFEREIALSRDRHTVINATASGARIRGALHLPLRQVLREHCAKDVGSSVSALRRRLSEPTPFDSRRLRSDLARVEWDVALVKRSVSNASGKVNLKAAVEAFDRVKRVLHFRAAPVLVRLFDLEGELAAARITRSEFESSVVEALSMFAADAPAFLQAGLDALS